MKKRPSPFIRAILFFFATSFLVGLWILNHNAMFLSFAAKNPPKYHPWDKCARGALCKGTVDANSKTVKDRKDCKPAGTEGCLTDYRDAEGNFCFSVRNPNCGSKKTEQPAPTPTPTATPIPTPTPTPTPTPIPTATPTPTPTAGPTPTPTPTSTPGPTPTPTPPQVLGAEAPKALPKTGFPTEAIFGIAVVGEVIGWLILRKFRS